jgi:diguanylate cyclase (GGDEF)-like protein
MILFTVLISMTVIMSVLSTLMTMDERRKNNVIDCASNIRRILIEASGNGNNNSNNNNNNNNINEALKNVGIFTKARSVIFFDANNEDYGYVSPEHREDSIPVAKRNTLKAELLRYVSELSAQQTSAVRVIILRQNSKLEKANPLLYSLLKEYNINEVLFSATVNHLNNITILGIINPKRRADALYLAEKISACFTIALNNHNILNKTKLAATTDSLTGTLNRVAYNNDLHIINIERPLDFSCIYVDVNELHAHNNKFGHAAGDEMLLYIAHTLKDVFFGHKIYRMGGDEFLIFTQGVGQDDIKKGIDIFLEALKPRNYHVAIGLSFRSQNANTEEMVREAEVRMYEAKAKYYQNKESKAQSSGETEFVQVKVGIPEIDTMISVLKENYNGIYRVSLDTDRANRVLMPAYLNYNETEDNFSRLFANYVSESAESDYHRSLLSFQNYDALKQQLSEGKIPKISYKKLNGETVTLSVYKLSESPNNVSDTLWIFAKK